jgi:protein-tyrosine kinase
MADRAGLIERAAALLRDGNGVPPEPPGQGTQPAPASPPDSVPPLNRTIVLDRPHLARSGIIMPWTTTARVVEEFRIIKRNIMFAWQTPDYLQRTDHPPRVVMVTSSRPREGKTFSSINLALAFAAEENIVAVLVDADPVRGDTARGLQVPVEPGLTGVLSGDVRLSDALIQSDLSNLVILPPGAPGPHVPELLTGARPGLVFAEIAARYPSHVIIMDTPPCMASTDPAALAPLVDQIVFVIEAERTQQAEIEASLNLLSGCRNIRFLLNKAPTGSSEHFGSYSYYYRPDDPAAKAGED